MANMPSSLGRPVRQISNMPSCWRRSSCLGWVGRLGTPSSRFANIDLHGTPHGFPRESSERPATGLAEE